MNIMFQFDDPIIKSSGGVERVTDTLAKELIKRGHNVIFLCNQKFSLINETTKLSAPQYCIDLGDKNKTRIKRELETICNKHSIQLLINQISNKKTLLVTDCLPNQIRVITVIHTQPFFADNIKRRQLLSIKSANIWQFLFKFASILNINIYKSFFNNLFIKELNLIVEKSDKVCLISERFFPRIQMHTPNIEFSKFVAINNPNTFASTYIDYQEKENIIMWVGRIENSGKNTIDFIRTWGILSKNNTNWKAVVVGNGPDLEYNKDFCRKNNIANIFFVGNVKNVEDYYKKAKFVVVTSWSESWCMILTEAMSFGCIPFAYNTYETLEDIIDNDINGYVVDAKVKSLSDCIQSIINDNIKQSIISRNAIEKSKKFTSDKIVDKWEQLINSIID